MPQVVRIGLSLLIAITGRYRIPTMAESVSLGSATPPRKPYENCKCLMDATVAFDTSVFEWFDNWKISSPVTRLCVTVVTSQARIV
jgi:hypothetical protein